MEVILDNWSKKDYSNLVSYLKEISESKYMEFSKKLTPGVDDILGIRVPVLRDIAKKIAKGNVKEYLALAGNSWHEEIQLHGLVIGYSKLPFGDVLTALDNFIPNINNWANCDVVCSNLKVFQKNRAEGFTYLENKLNSDNPWQIRFVLIQYLAHYLCDEFIDKVLEKCLEVKSDHYYVKMGNAWLLSTAYIKYPEKTLPLLEKNLLDSWTHNKTIQKIIESNRVDKAAKDEIRKLKVES